MRTAVLVLIGLVLVSGVLLIFFADLVSAAWRDRAKRGDLEQIAALATVTRILRLEHSLAMHAEQPEDRCDRSCWVAGRLAPPRNTTVRR